MELASPHKLLTEITMLALRKGRVAPGGTKIMVPDTLVFKMNEYFIESNQAKLKFLNQFLNLI